MCTCLEFTNIDHYFGRTLDLEYHYNEEAVITPRNYEFKSRALCFKNKYALIGTAMVIDDYPFYYEASNEYGLAMAGLNFPNNAKYNEPMANKLNLAMFELIPYLLGNYKSLKELEKDLVNLNITNICYSPNMPITPLHYMLSDGNRTIVLEQTVRGLEIYDNPYGVMTNNPEFNLQIENLKNYSKLTNEFKAASHANYHCVGLGAVGLPGDYSSMSRLVKAEFLRKHRDTSLDGLEGVSDFFHILASVSMVKGSVLAKNGASDITFYTSCINTTKNIYYYKTYNNSQITALALTEENMNRKALTRHPLIIEEQINYLNK